MCRHVQVQRQSRSLDGRWVPQSDPVSPAICYDRKCLFVYFIVLYFILLVCPHLGRPRLKRALLEDFCLSGCGDKEPASTFDVVSNVPGNTKT